MEQQLQSVRAEAKDLQRRYDALYAEFQRAKDESAAKLHEYQQREQANKQLLAAVQQRADRQAQLDGIIALLQQRIEQREADLQSALAQKEEEIQQLHSHFELLSAEQAALQVPIEKLRTVLQQCGGGGGSGTAGELSPVQGNRAGYRSAGSHTSSHPDSPRGLLSLVTEVCSQCEYQLRLQHAQQSLAGEASGIMSPLQQHQPPPVALASPAVEAQAAELGSRPTTPVRTSG